MGTSFSVLANAAQQSFHHTDLPAFLLMCTASLTYRLSHCCHAWHIGEFWPKPSTSYNISEIKPTAILSPITQCYSWRVDMADARQGIKLDVVFGGQAAQDFVHLAAQAGHGGNRLVKGFQCLLRQAHGKTQLNTIGK